MRRRVPKQASNGVLTLVLGTVIVFALLPACQRNAEASHAVIAERQSSWARQLATIKAEQSGLKERFARDVAAPAGASPDPSVLRARATLDGLGQSIADVENQMQQVSGRLEAAVGRGGDAADKALQEETARISGSLQGLVAELVTVSEQMNAFGNDERNSKNE